MSVGHSEEGLEDSGFVHSRMKDAPARVTIRFYIAVKYGEDDEDFGFLIHAHDKWNFAAKGL